MSHYLPHLPLEERYQRHFDEVNDFNDYRLQTIENLDRQSCVMDRLVSKRQKSITTIRHSVLSRERCRLHQEKQPSDEWYTKREDGRTKPQISTVRVVPDDEEVESMLPCHLRRTAVETDLKKFTMVEKQVKHKFEQHTTRLGRRHVQLQILRMQQPHQHQEGVGRPRRTIPEGITGGRVVQNNNNNNILGDDNHEHNRIPWQNILAQPGQNLGLREINLDVGENDLRFMVLREFAGNLLP